VEKEMSRQKIPQIDSIQQLAAFWDTHDLTEFEDELEVVGSTVFERQAELVAVPLQPTEVEAVKRIANSRGIGYDALIREWVIEKLHTS
jgi:predicted DNA binding CopG/RHH family protein